MATRKSPATPAKKVITPEQIRFTPEQIREAVQKAHAAAVQAKLDSINEEFIEEYEDRLLNEALVAVRSAINNYGNRYDAVDMLAETVYEMVEDEKSDTLSAIDFYTTTLKQLENDITTLINDHFDKIDQPKIVDRFIKLAIDQIMTDF